MFFSIWTESAFVNRRRFKGFLPGRSASQSQSASQRRGNASEMNEFDVSVSLYIYMHFFPLDILSLSLQTVKYFCLTSFLLVVSSLFFGSIFKFLFGLIISSLYSCVLFVYLLFIFSTYFPPSEKKNRWGAPVVRSRKQATAGFHPNNTSPPSF